MTAVFTSTRLFILLAIFGTTALAGCQAFHNTPSVPLVAKLPKPTKPTLGLPITYDLLALYQWRLVSAVSNTYDDNGRLIRAPIGNFYHPDYPVSTSFESWPDNQYVFFYSNCNDSRAPYFLLKDNTFKVGHIINTVMSCGETGNRIETALFNIMNDSSSKLTLSLQPSPPTSELTSDIPRYNLLQTMDSGETLIWKNTQLQNKQ